MYLHCFQGSWLGIKVSKWIEWFFPPRRVLEVLSNLLKFKGIQAPDIEKKSSGWRASRIASVFEDSKTWRITNFKGYLKIEGLWLHTNWKLVNWRNCCNHDVTTRFFVILFLIILCVFIYAYMWLFILWCIFLGFSVKRVFWSFCEQG